MQNQTLVLPEAVQTILRRLNDYGYSAYAVGGCVRDSMLGLTPKDWDLCTSATPDEMQAVFKGWHVVETGLKHGTLTVVLEHVPYEVTTFRVDGSYTDHRHPDGVTFVRAIGEDLARRDFTVNAMAYNQSEGLVDLFFGRQDLAARVIRCVGEPEKRFEEDALRILRALRFASVYDFTIDPGTADAIHALYPTMKDVAAERIRVELCKLLRGKGVARILREYTDVITFLVPELKPTVGFEQKTPYHRWDVWEHTIRTIDAILPDEVLRLTMLLHDAGKPACFTVDAKGIGHSYGHADVSLSLARTFMERIKADNATRDRVLLLVEHHDIDLFEEPRMMRRRLAQFGEEVVRQLIEVHRSDACGKGTESIDEIDHWRDRMVAALDAVLAERPCFTLKTMQLNGRDLQQLGFPKGPQIGQCLNALLEHVVDQTLPNDTEVLRKAASEWLQAQQAAQN